MNWLIILVILVVIGFIVGPILALKPNLAQKNSMYNREVARKNNVLMQMVNLDTPHWFKNPQKLCMQYYLIRANKIKALNNNWDYWQIEPGKWVDNLRYACLDEINYKLNNLPNAVYRVVLNEQMLALYVNDGKIDKNTNQIKQVIEFLHKNMLDLD